MAITISGSGTITGLSAGGLPDGSVTAGDLASTLDLTGKTVTLPSGTGGKLLQVVQTIKTDTFSTSAANFVDVTGLSASITPSSTSNKILVMATVNYLATGGGSNGFRLVRGSTAIAIGDAASNRPRFSSMNQDGSATTDLYTSNVNYLDSPSTTSSTTYKIQAFSWYGGDWYLNRTALDRDTTQYDCRTASSIILMEIAG